MPIIFNLSPIFKSNYMKFHNLNLTDNLIIHKFNENDSIYLHDLNDDQFEYFYHDNKIIQKIVTSNNQDDDGDIIELFKKDESIYYLDDNIFTQIFKYYVATDFFDDGEVDFQLVNRLSINHHYQNNLIKSIKDSNGNEELFYYKNNKLSKKIITKDNVSLTYLYDYDKHGNLISSHNGVSQTIYEYNNHNQKIKEIHQSSTINTTIHYSYDLNNNILSIISDKTHSSYNYNKHNLITQIFMKDHNGELQMNIQYNDKNYLKHIQYNDQHQEFFNFTQDHILLAIYNDHQSIFENPFDIIDKPVNNNFMFSNFTIH